MLTIEFTPTIFTDGHGEPLNAQNLNNIFDATCNINNLLGKEADITKLKEKILDLEQTLNNKVCFNVYEFTPEANETISFKIDNYSSSDIVLYDPSPQLSYGLYGLMPGVDISEDGQFVWQYPAYHGFPCRLIHIKPSIIIEL